MAKYEAAIKRARDMLVAGGQVAEGGQLTSRVATVAIHSGHNAFDHPGTGHPVIPPISLSTTFCQRAPAECLKYDYSRAGNYSRDVLEETIAATEDAQFCCCFSSGLAALSAITQLLCHGDHGLFFNDVYGGTNRYFTKVASKFGLDFQPVDMQDLAAFKQALRPTTRLVWVETPSNPLMRIVDIRAVAEAAKAQDPRILVVVDNTFLTPVFQLPLRLGADLVVHSLTKYMNGHSDVLMGAAVTNQRPLYDALRSQQLMVGAVPSPFDCYLALRGLRTLVVRMGQHQLAGLALALFLQGHPRVDRVLHPALAESPCKEVIAKQMSGYSGMLSVYLHASKEDTIKVIQGLKYFHIAESLGGFESLVEIP